MIQKQHKLKFPSCKIHRQMEGWGWGWGWDASEGTDVKLTKPVVKEKRYLHRILHASEMLLEFLLLGGGGVRNLFLELGVYSLWRHTSACREIL